MWDRRGFGRSSGSGRGGGSPGAGGVARGELEGLGRVAVRGEGLRSELAVRCRSFGDMQ